MDTIHNPVVEDCELCSGKVQSPYILLNCQHAFCKICVVGFIKHELTMMDGCLYCPKKGCNDKINLYDVQLIIGEHLFEKAADERVKKYIDQSD